MGTHSLNELQRLELTHYGLVVPYGNIGLGQHWLRYLYHNSWGVFYLSHCKAPFDISCDLTLTVKTWDEPVGSFQTAVWSYKGGPLTHWALVTHTCIIKLSLVQMMACRLVSAKPLSKCIYQMHFLNENIQIRLKFHWGLFPRVLLTIFQHWFR